jgi:hypothetical protein
MMRAMRARLLLLFGALGALALAYRRVLRDRHLTWGATPEEAGASLPGDELLPDADIVATRAVRIDAPSSEVWPWLVQMGPGRGGAYTYDWIENLLGLDIHSADEVLPDFQDLEVGDEPGLGMRVELLEPERVLASRSGDGRWVWSFVLVPDEGGTRLVSRNRISMRGGGLGARLGMIVMEPGSWVMERKMLLGIKERAERMHAQTAVR